MLMQWLIMAATVGAFAACLYMWSSAEQLPERWHRLFRLGSWGAILGAPVGASAQWLLQHDGRWWELSTLSDPSQRIGLILGAMAGSTLACRLAKLDIREAFQMAATALSPYLLGLAAGAGLAGHLYAFFMIDAWEAPIAYRQHVMHTLAGAYIILSLAAATLFSLGFTGRVWRIWGAAVPEDVELLALQPLDLEAEPEETEAQA